MGLKSFDVIVVGAGMMGSAAARHLALMGKDVALIGPAEPEHKASHTGVFASHYDQARITRALDTRADWSRFAMQSIARYSEIERASEHRFFHEVGSLMAGPEGGEHSGFVQSCEQVGAAHLVDYDRLQGAKLAARFPYFRFPEGIVGLFEAKNAGYVNPRDHVQAQILAATRSGAVLIRGEVTGIDGTADGVSVTCADGQVYRAEKVIVACGPFSNIKGLLPQPVELTMFARTVTFFEIEAEEAERLDHMPTLIYVSPDGATDIYTLPPVIYPDGKCWLKLGGGPVDAVLESVADIKDWFRTDGNLIERDALAGMLLEVMPDLKFRSITSGSCVTSFTPNGNPLIYSQTERITALTGGNGSGAKSSDELGRLGALAATGELAAETLYQTDFGPGT
ncbi:MAG: FAD-dependent oxidoreductase [Rhodobacteraceae bacterium]|nr:FAD-dependent oxidoreductase [Paracoccaceae bacterium]